jgi:hypothetical protein
MNGERIIQIVIRECGHIDKTDELSETEFLLFALTDNGNIYKRKLRDESEYSEEQRLKKIFEPIKNYTYELWEPVKLPLLI